MFQDLVTQFLGSSAATETIAAITQQAGLNQGQAQQAVEATAQGVAQAAQGSGGLTALAGSLLGGGGGGLAGLAGGLLGGGAQAGTSPLVDTIAGVVSEKLGLNRDVARTVVGIALPKVMAYFQGAGGGGNSGGGGLLGGLFGS